MTDGPSITTFGPSITTFDIAVIPQTEAAGAQVSTSSVPTQDVDSNGAYGAAVTPLSRPDAPVAPIVKARDARGRFAGPDGAAQHYLGAQPDHVPTHYRQAEAALLDQSITDDGGREELSARRVAQHEYRALVHRRIWQLSDALDARGMLDKRGKLRVAWIQRLESLITLATRIDGSLGLNRRTKPVASLEDVLRG